MKDFVAQKQLILEHVLYEMEMYLFTLDVKAPNQLLSNVIWVAHQTHMRNLLYFFSDNKKFETDINYLDLLDGVFGLGIDDSLNLPARNVVNKSISHLTMERVTSNLDTAAKTEIKKMKNIIPQKIEDFISLLQTNIKTIYEPELYDSEINDIINVIQSKLIEFKRH